MAALQRASSQYGYQHALDQLICQSLPEQGSPFIGGDRAEWSLPAHHPSSQPLSPLAVQLEGNAAGLWEKAGPRSALLMGDAQVHPPLVATSVPAALQDCTIQASSLLSTPPQFFPEPDKQNHEAMQAQVQWLYASLAAQQAEQLKLQNEVQLLRDIAGPALVQGNSQWLALQLQRAHAAASAAAVSQPVPQGGWRLSVTPVMNQRRGVPNDGLTHKERRRRRRAQEREAAAHVAMAACAHCLPEGPPVSLPATPGLNALHLN